MTLNENERQDLSERIHAVWLILAGAGSRGSRAWFAGQVNVEPRTVFRWLAGDSDPYLSDKGVQAILWLEKQERTLRKQRKLV